MKRILVIHCDIYGFGGAENFAIKLVRTLQDFEFDVTVLHSGGTLDVVRIRERMGIELDPSKVRFVQISMFRRFPGLLAGALLLRYAFVLRQARQIANDFDFIVGTYGETPLLVKKLLQTVHIPLFFFDRESLCYLGVRAPTILQLAVRSAYVIVSRLIAGWSRETVSKHLMITNSQWTAAQFARHYPKARIESIYHGVATAIAAGHPDYLAHEQRSNTVVIIGRVVPFKRVHLGIEIVDRLRALGHHDLGLLIIGGGGGAYVQAIEVMQASRPYIEWRRDLPRLEMEKIIARQRWGLHVAQNEHYGLAPLELQRLGCVTFVHNSGGQVEAVRDADLKYDDIDDAVEKMDRVIRDGGCSQRLFEGLPENVAVHTTDGFRLRFIQRMREEGFFDA
ncbi:hypothetical protein DIC66_22545 [Rhodoferax lacus]|uniref:Glycosyltransferase n=1 Tax=Rhodoferax lacus TaxID=2184758 RepID=A0A3E1R5L4_9BURK|nr:glycosyltransferase [Rhodoferax lacus]RFO94624.1 hypothetical protein DIC66_22545 [Rhodoferax lacus]